MKEHSSRKKPRKKKPNKQQRDARRAHDADLFNMAFAMGFEVGLQEGRKEGADHAHREKLKWAHLGR